MSGADRSDRTASFIQRHAMALFLSVSLLLIFAGGASLWMYFGLSGQSSYGERAVVFEPLNLRLPPEIAGDTGRIRLVHFWDPDCTSCNRETSAHLSYLTSIYRRSKIDFYSVQKPHSRGKLPDFLHNKLKPLPYVEGMETIPASPTVAIWNAEGKLVYAGPYSLGMVCTSANSFVEPILDQLVAGKAVQNPANGLLAVGCYCPW